MKKEQLLKKAGLKVGDKVKDGVVKDHFGSEVSLSSLWRSGPVLVIFYRGGWCPFCNTQLGQLKKIEKQLTNMGFQLLGVSTDNANDLQTSLKKHQVNYQLISDYHSTLSQAFGLAYFTSQKTTERYLNKLKLSNPLQKNARNEDRLVLPVPAVYIIDKNGLVQFNYVNPNYKVRLHEALLLKAASLIED